MARYTITPWRTHADLLFVRQQLYQLTTDGLDSRRHAVDRVMAWKVRGNLPHAVESTALLVDAMLHHDRTNNSIFSIRAVYSAAFTRFVTGFCDIGRNRERALEPSSMLEIARQIDMPSEFVALRHEATHEELPSVQRIVMVCGQALQWLWRVYWSRLEEPPVEITSMMSGQQVKDEARQLFKEYRSETRRIFKQKNQSGSERVGLVVRTSSAIDTLCRASSLGTKDVAEVLVLDKILLPSDRRLGTTMQGAFVLWDDLLLALSEQHKPFLSKLIEHLIIAINEPSLLDSTAEDPEKEAYYLWLVRMASSAQWTRVGMATTGHLPSVIIRQCCLNPGYWTETLGQTLLEMEADNTHFVELWFDLVEASAVRDEDSEVGVEVGMEDESMRDSYAEMSKPNARSGLAVGLGNEDDIRGWREAPVPLDLPIGVVQ